MPRADNQIFHLRLMLQRHQRHDVAVRRQIGAGIEERLQVRHILAAFGRRHASPVAPGITALPMCTWSPVVPVTYQPPHRSFRGLRWSVIKPPAFVIGMPFLSGKTERTISPGTPSVAPAWWHWRQVSRRSNCG